MVGDYNSAEDLAQDSWESALRYYGDELLTANQPFGLMRKIATRKALDKIRHEKRNPPPYREPLGHAALDPTQNPMLRIQAPEALTDEQAIINSVFPDLERRAMNILPELYHPLLTLYLQGCSYEEMVSQLGRPLGTIKNQINRIKKHLQQAQKSGHFEDIYTP